MEHKKGLTQSSTVRIVVVGDVQNIVGTSPGISGRKAKQQITKPFQSCYVTVIALALFAARPPDADDLRITSRINTALLTRLAHQHCTSKRSCC